MHAKLYYCGRAHTKHYAQADDGNLYWWRRGGYYNSRNKVCAGHWVKSHHATIESVAEFMGVNHKPKLIGEVTMTGNIIGAKQ